MIQELFGQTLRQQEEIIRAINRRSDVPLDTLRAILRDMGDLAWAVDAGEIIKKLAAKAEECEALTERLNCLSNADPEVSRLRREAAEALKSGRFTKADAHLAAAEARDLAGLDDLETLAKQKRLSAPSRDAALS
jgi:hypothetical protein